jgi:hypothetical protein
MTFAARTFFGYGAAKPNLTNHSLTDFNAGTGIASAWVSFNNDGTLSAHTNNGGTNYHSNEWWTGGPLTSSEAALYELVVVVTSGALQYGSAGTFNLGVSRQIGCNVAANGGEKTAVCTTSIRRVSDGVVMASATMDFTATSSNQ